MAKFYICTSLKRKKEHNIVRDILVEGGHEITHDWSKIPDLDVLWKRERKISCLQEQNKAVADSDFVVVLLPGGRGTHCGLGVASYLEKPTFIHAYEDWDMENSLFYWHGGARHLMRMPIYTFAHQICHILEIEEKSRIRKVGEIQPSL